jgi:hypothetical protein
MAQNSLNPPPRRPIPANEQIDRQRRELFQAQGIVECVRHSVASHMDGLQDTSISDALLAASRIIDNVASELDEARVGRAEE